MVFLKKRAIWIKWKNILVEFEEVSNNGETDIGFPCDTSNMNEVEKHITFYSEMEHKFKEKSCKNSTGNEA